MTQQADELMSQAYRLLDPNGPLPYEIGSPLWHDDARDWRGHYHEWLGETKNLEEQLMTLSTKDPEPEPDPDLAKEIPSIPTNPETMRQVARIEAYGALNQATLLLNQAEGLEKFRPDAIVSNDPRTDDHTERLRERAELLINLGNGWARLIR